MLFGVTKQVNNTTKSNNKIIIKFWYNQVQQVHYPLIIYASNCIHANLNNLCLKKSISNCIHDPLAKCIAIILVHNPFLQETHLVPNNIVPTKKSFTFHNALKTFLLFCCLFFLLFLSFEASLTDCCCRFQLNVWT